MVTHILTEVSDFPLLTPLAWVTPTLHGSTKLVLEYRYYTYGLFTYKQKVRRFLVDPSSFRKKDFHSVTFEAIQEGKKTRTVFEAHTTDKVSTVTCNDIDGKKHPLNRDMFFEPKVPEGKSRYRLQFETFLGQQLGVNTRFVDIETLNIYGEPPRVINGFFTWDNFSSVQRKRYFVLCSDTPSSWTVKFS